MEVDEAHAPDGAEAPHGAGGGDQADKLPAFGKQYQSLGSAIVGVALGLTGMLGAQLIMENNEYVVPPNVAKRAHCA